MKHLEKKNVRWIAFLLFTILIYFNLFISRVQSDELISYSSPSWSSDNELIFVSDQAGNKDIWRSDARFNQLNNITNSPNLSETYPSFSPNAEIIAFISEPYYKNDILIESDLWIIQLHSNQFTKKNLTEKIDGNVLSYDWDNNSESIVIRVSTTSYTEQSVGMQFWIVNIGNASADKIFDDVRESGYFGPKWSFDGKEIVFWGITPVERTIKSIYIYDVSTKNINQFDITLEIIEALWLNEPHKIAFIGFDRPTNVLGLYTLDTITNKVVVLHQSTDDGPMVGLAYSVDGMYLTFSSTNYFKSDDVRLIQYNLLESTSKELFSLNNSSNLVAVPSPSGDFIAVIYDNQACIVNIITDIKLCINDE